MKQVKTLILPAISETVYTIRLPLHRTSSYIFPHGASSIQIVDKGQHGLVFTINEDATHVYEYVGPYLIEWCNDD